MKLARASRASQFSPKMLATALCSVSPAHSTAAQVALFYVSPNDAPIPVLAYETNRGNIELVAVGSGNARYCWELIVPDDRRDGSQCSLLFLHGKHLVLQALRSGMSYFFNISALFASNSFSGQVYPWSASRAFSEVKGPAELRCIAGLEDRWAIFAFDPSSNQFYMAEFIINTELVHVHLQHFDSKSVDQAASPLRSNATSVIQVTTVHLDSSSSYREVQHNVYVAMVLDLMGGESDVLFASSKHRSLPSMVVDSSTSVLWEDRLDLPLHGSLSLAAHPLSDHVCVWTADTLLVGHVQLSLSSLLPPSSLLRHVVVAEHHLLLLTTAATGAQAALYKYDLEQLQLRGKIVFPPNEHFHGVDYNATTQQLVIVLHSQAYLVQDLDRLQPPSSVESVESAQDSSEAVLAVDTPLSVLRRTVECLGRVYLLCRREVKLVQRMIVQAMRPPRRAEGSSLTGIVHKLGRLEAWLLRTSSAAVTTEGGVLSSIVKHLAVLLSSLASGQVDMVMTLAADYLLHGEQVGHQLAVCVCLWAAESNLPPRWKALRELIACNLCREHGLGDAFIAFYRETLLSSTAEEATPQSKLSLGALLVRNAIMDYILSLHIWYRE